MTIALSARRPLTRNQRTLAYCAVVVALALSLWIGANLAPPPWLHLPALFVHLSSVIVGLGAAVTLELTGLLWITGRRTLDEVRRSEGVITLIAWAGIIGLIASGAFLHPNLGDPKTVVKMVAVLVVALNGVAMTGLTASLARLPNDAQFTTLASRLKARCVVCGAVSQLGWWTAVVIGMLNTSAR